MLTEDHIFSIKTKDDANVADVKNGGTGIVITGLNVLREQIKVGDFVFVVFGGDKPKGWTPGLVALAHISREPFSVAEDQGRNFRVEIDVDVYFQPSIVRADLVTYPDTFGTIGIGPITKWEPNQAITSVLKRNAIGLIQAICDLRPQKLEEIKSLLGVDFALINKPVRRYVESTSKLGAPNDLSSLEKVDLRDEFEKWLADGRTSAKTAYENAASYIPSIDDGLAEPTKQIWHGLREALYGERSTVRIYAVRSYAELMANFGGLDAIFDQGTDRSMFDQSNYQKCFDWAHDSINHGSIRAAWRWYKKFLQWKDAQKSETEINGDLLTVALKQFKNAREAGGPSDARYWVFSPGEQACRWDEMRDGGVMALSYEECGRDLREYANEEAIRAEFKSSEEDDASYKNHVRALTDFLNVMKPGDLVFAKKGTKTFLGVGRVTGEYEFAADASGYKHRRAVEWLKVETIERDDAVARKTLTDVTRYGDLVRELCEAYGISDSGLSGGAGWSGYWELNPGARQYFDELRMNIDKLDKDKVVEMFTGVKKNGKVVFKPMWSGSNGTGWDSVKKGLEEENSKTIETIQRYCASAADLAVFATKEDDKDRPSGFGNSVESELLMKFHPDVAIKCGRKTIAVYRDLQLMEFKRPDDYSATEYTKALGIAADIRQRMDQLGITRMVEDKEPADYLTVNEFIAWCGDNNDLIKEEIMAKEFKKVEKKPKKDGAKKLSDMMKDELLKRLAAALRTKPFAILAGHSGTGKSQMVRRLAYMTCADEGLMAEAKEKNAPGNFCMIQVRPNWHDSTDLLGYYSELGKKYRTTEFVEFVAKAHAYPEIPFFVCLDEMNLAPVEQYFAEYLSAIESADVKGGEFLTDALVSKEFPADEVMFHDEVRFSESKAWFEKHGLTIPKNLFVVGTVNMDDTTCQFSRKVLDRAMTIMMDKVSFRDMQDAAKSAAPSEADLLQYDDIKAFLGGELRAKPLDDDQIKMLEALEGVLGKTPFAVAYRYANEYALYEDSLLALEGKKHEDADADHAKTAMDHCVLMKVLPRVHGERKEMELIFRGKSDGTEKGLEGLLDKDTTLSGKKMEEILARKATYLSFWP